MVHKRTLYTIDALKSVKILTAFNASGDVNVLILTYASFHLPGGLMPCDIITSFVYFEFRNDLLLDLQWAIESGGSVTISRGQLCKHWFDHQGESKCAPEQYDFVKTLIGRTKSCANKYLYSITKLGIMQ